MRGVKVPVMRISFVSWQPIDVLAQCAMRTRGCSADFGAYSRLDGVEKVPH
jgi:hypothetical protein